MKRLLLLIFIPVLMFGQFKFQKSLQDRYVSLYVKGDRLGDYQDYSPNHYPYTQNGTLSNNTFYKFGTHSLYFDEGYTSILTFDTASMNVPNMPFTCEFWVYTQSAEDYYSYFTNYSHGASLAYGIVMWQYSGSVILYVSSTTTGTWFAGLNPITCGTILTNQWVHYAVCRDENNVWRTYQQGILKGTVTANPTIHSPTTTYPPAIGGWRNNYNLKGWIQGFRFVKGKSLYTGGTVGTQYFTPPNKPY